MVYFQLNLLLKKFNLINLTKKFYFLINILYENLIYRNDVITTNMIIKITEKIISGAVSNPIFLTSLDTKLSPVIPI